MKITFDLKKNSVSISDCMEPITIEDVERLDILYATVLTQIRAEALTEGLYEQTLEMIEGEVRDNIVCSATKGIPSNS